MTTNCSARLTCLMEVWRFLWQTMAVYGDQFGRYSCTSPTIQVCSTVKTYYTAKFFRNLADESSPLANFLLLVVVTCHRWWIEGSIFHATWLVVRVCSFHLYHCYCKFHSVITNTNPYLDSYGNAEILAFIDYYPPIYLSLSLSDRIKV